MAFINLTGSEVAIIAAAALTIMAAATYKVIKAERGFKQILWLFGIYFVPPVFAIIYLVKYYLFQAAHPSQDLKSA